MEAVTHHTVVIQMFDDVVLINEAMEKELGVTGTSLTQNEHYDLFGLIEALIQVAVIEELPTCSPTLDERRRKAYALVFKTLSDLKIALDKCNSLLDSFKGLIVNRIRSLVRNHHKTVMNIESNLIPASRYDVAVCLW